MKTSWKLMLLSFVLLSGCASLHNTQTILDSWVGHNASELNMVWGPPTETRDSSNGTKWLIYNQTIRTMDLFTGMAQGMQAGSGAGQYYSYRQAVIPVSCSVSFLINDKGRVIRTWYVGNYGGHACKTKTSQVKQLLPPDNHQKQLAAPDSSPSPSGPPPYPGPNGSASDWGKYSTYWQNFKP